MQVMYDSSFFNYRINARRASLEMYCKGCAPGGIGRSTRSMTLEQLLTWALISSRVSATRSLMLQRETISRPARGWREYRPVRKGPSIKSFSSMSR